MAWVQSGKPRCGAQYSWQVSRAGRTLGHTEHMERGGRGAYRASRVLCSGSHTNCMRKFPSGAARVPIGLSGLGQLLI